MYWRIAALAACLLCVAASLSWAYRKGARDKDAEWVTKAQASEIRALKAEAERDEISRQVAGQTAKELSRSLAEVEVRREEVIQRIVPLLPEYPASCALPDSVRDDIQAEIDRIEATRSSM
jgi:hypothetical protein